jgi:dihydroorotase
MYIDCHVHCRDFEWSHKETIAHALNVAKDSGLSGIFDMPNTRPPVTTREKILERLALAKNEDSPVFYGTYIGVTSNPDQIREAVETYREFSPKNMKSKNYAVVGLKMFAGKSVGNLTISTPQEQVEVYNSLGKLGYSGVLFVHCEKESKMYPELWNSEKPISHSEARPEISEIASIDDQIDFAIYTDFFLKGHLHIAHVSTPRSVEIINSYKYMMNISCGATPHHLLLNNKIMNDKHGIFYKVNPPLRKRETQEGLLNQFKRGLIDLLESDHAPHTLDEKTKDYMSGIPQLPSWPVFTRFLRKKGVSQSLLDRVAFENVNKIFGTNIKRLNCPIKSHKGEYAFEPFDNLNEN